MKVQLTIVVLIGLVAVGIARAPRSAEGAQAAKTAEGAQAAKTIWDGVYTPEQAKRGAATYREHCSTCHLPDLTGGGDGMAPGLAGAEFLSFWDGLTVAELLQRAQAMPPGMESSMTDQERADVIAHVLRFNKVPAGRVALGHDVAELEAITITAAK